MTFLIENTPQKQKSFNAKTNKIYNWVNTIPWNEFGIDSTDGINKQEIINLQTIIGSDADGLVGLGTLRKLQSYFLESDILWCPFSGELKSSNTYFIWKGLKVPTLLSDEFEIVPFTDANGIDLHGTGNFNKASRDLKQVVVHWGGLNPQHLARVFSNRKASSHFAVGRCEVTNKVKIFQMIDLAHITWHSVGGNRNSIGIDVCQQPELKHLGYYRKHNYKVDTIENPAYEFGYGPKKIISLDTEIESATVYLLFSLIKSFGIDFNMPDTATKRVSKEQFEEGGLFSHFHADFKNKGKWDIAPWWDKIADDLSDYLSRFC